MYMKTKGLGSKPPVEKQGSREVRFRGGGTFLDLIGTPPLAEDGGQIIILPPVPARSVLV